MKLPSLAAAFIAATSLLATTSARNAKKSHTHHHTPDTTKSNATAETRETSHKAYWYTQMDHTGAARGIAPYAPGGEKWEVYVAAKTNDTQSIFDAIEKGGREKEWIVSNPRVVYVPPGTYEFDRELWCHIDTIIVGDPRDMPVFKPAGNFSKKAKFFIHGRDKDVGEQGENSFAVGLKNVIIDLTDFQSNQQLTALDWSVAQAAQLTNIHIKLRNYSGKGKDKGQIGIQQRRGSTLALSDITIEGGAIGIWQNGHQQMLYKGITFLRNRVGLKIDGGNAVVLLGCTFNTVGTSIAHTSGTPGVTAVDCKSVDSGVFFKSSGGEVPSIAIESLDLDRVNEDVVQLPLMQYTLGPTKRVDTFTYGNTVDKETESGATYGASKATRERPQVIAPDGHLPTVPAPTYAEAKAEDFINVKDNTTNGGYTVHGDDTHDDTENLNAVLRHAAHRGKIAYFPFGVYRVQHTLHVPLMSRLVGEAWATISAHGTAFADPKNPLPVVQVGNATDSPGVAQISDMRFTVSRVLPGAIILQLNAAGSRPADVGVWNSMVTVGGTKGARDVADTCTDVDRQCRAAYTGLHLAGNSSAYVENTWVWVADHMAEPDGAGGVYIAAKQGVRVESDRGTWLYGLGAEHFWFYSLGLIGARNVAVALLQAETNYDQGQHAAKDRMAPAPWGVSKGEGDPGFRECKRRDGGCRTGYAAYVDGGSDVFVYGVGGYKFFDGSVNQTTKARNTGDGKNQGVMLYVDGEPDNFQLFNVATHQSKNIIRLAKDKVIGNDDMQGPWAPGSGLLGRYGPTNVTSGS